MKTITKWIISKTFGIKPEVKRKVGIFDLYKKLKRKKYKKIDVLECVKRYTSITTNGQIDYMKDMKECLSKNNTFKESEYDGLEFAKGK